MFCLPVETAPCEKMDSEERGGAAKPLNKGGDISQPRTLVTPRDAFPSFHDVYDSLFCFPLRTRPQTNGLGLVVR